MSDATTRNDTDELQRAAPRVPLDSPWIGHPGIVGVLSPEQIEKVRAATSAGQAPPDDALEHQPLEQPLERQPIEPSNIVSSPQFSAIMGALTAAIDERIGRALSTLDTGPVTDTPSALHLMLIIASRAYGRGLADGDARIIPALAKAYAVEILTDAECKGVEYDVGAMVRPSISDVTIIEGRTRGRSASIKREISRARSIVLSCVSLAEEIT